jgi:hypothetical protein
MVPVSERAKTVHALDRSATVTGKQTDMTNLTMADFFANVRKLRYMEFNYLPSSPHL